ncbi:hypothetical protein C8R44DRAFT_760775 [Mycena epipterygia]|nr:hypothetical protein C8R44DRAFT_760775 [Mycena epipterygia]
MFSTPDLAATYATLILVDAESEITAQKILALTTVAGVDIKPIWATLLAKTLEGKNVKEMLSTIGVDTGAAAPRGAVAEPVKEAAVEPVEAAPTHDGGDSDSDDNDGLPPGYTGWMMFD